MSDVADQERHKIRQRQTARIAVSKQHGKHLGRPKMNLSTLTKDQLKMIDTLYPKWKNGEVTAVLFMGELGMKKDTFYKIIKEYEDASE